MSQENVETMKRAIERFNRGGEDDAVLDDFYSPEAVYHSRDDEPDTGVYRGRDAIKGLAHMWRDTFEDFAYEVDEYLDRGDVLVMLGWVRVRARGSAAPIREPYTWVVKMHDGRVVEVHEYRTKQEALKAVGLEE